MELSFAEISNVSLKEDDGLNDGDTITITTISNEIMKFKSADASTIFKWLNYLLTQLKKRSVYAVAIQNFSKISSDESYLDLKKGDLITLDQTGEVLMAMNSTWALGSADEKKGYFPIDSAYILPCIMPPKKEILHQFAKDSAKQKTLKKSLYNTIQRQKMHNLRKFAEDYFRPNIE